MAKKKEKPQKNNRTRNLIGILFFLIIVLVVVLIFGKVFKNDNNDNDTNNKNENAISDKVIDNVSFSNIHCSYDGFRSLLKYTVTNNGSTSVMLEDYEIVVKDSSGTVLAIMVPGGSEELKPGEEIDTGNSIDIDLSDVSDIELRLSE